MELILADGITQEQIQDFLSIPMEDIQRFFMIHNYTITRVGIYAANKDVYFCFYNRNRGPEIWVVPQQGSINGGPSWDELWEQSNTGKLPIKIEWDDIIIKIN